MAKEQDQSAQSRRWKNETVPDEAFAAPTRSPITVQTYEIDSNTLDKIFHRGLNHVIPNVHRPILRITHVDRETFERMK